MLRRPRQSLTILPRGDLLLCYGLNSAQWSEPRSTSPLCLHTSLSETSKLPCTEAITFYLLSHGPLPPPMVLLHVIDPLLKFLLHHVLAATGFLHIFLVSIILT